MTPVYKVLLASPWANEQQGTKGVTWTQVGRAFLSRDGDGMTVFLHANLSVTGTLAIKLDDDRKPDMPSAHQPFPPGGPDDDTPF